MANIKDAEFYVPEDFEEGNVSKFSNYSPSEPILILVRDFDVQADTSPEIIITEEIQSQITNADILVALIYMDGKKEKFINYLSCEPRSFDIGRTDYKLKEVKIEYLIKTDTKRDFVRPGIYYFVFTTSLKFGPKRLYSEAFEIRKQF